MMIVIKSGWMFAVYVCYVVDVDDDDDKINISKSQWQK